jgi:hypothetical protein
MPPLRGIPLDHLVLALEIPSESSRRASFFDRSLGIPDSGTRNWLSNTYLGLQGKEKIAVVHLFARWARLFRREPLRHCTGAEFVASRL